MPEPCISCGMPLGGPAAVPAANPSARWCAHCARDDGSLKSYDETLDGMTEFAARTKGLPMEDARAFAREHMACQPAWKDHPGADDGA